jgi:ATP adenylyltransferase
MDQLWAPWRMGYIKNVDKKDDGCIFCTKPAENDDRKNYILHRGKKAFVLMNLYPYNNGHLMVIPYQHTADMLDLPAETASEVWSLLCSAKKALYAAIRPDAFNIGMNIGRTAGAGIDQHIHIHIVPRWNGDTNFMPVIGETKIISQGIDETYDILLPLFTSTADNGSSLEPS